MKHITINDLVILNCISYAREFETDDFDNVYSWALEFNYPGLKNAGLIHEEEFSKIISHIKNKKELFEKIKIISVDRTYVSEDVLIISFEYQKNIFVIFRGTAGALEWHDNAVGAFRSTLETPMQLQAHIYFNEIYNKYKNKVKSFYVSGHSKGGNKAKYVMIKNANLRKLRHCYSFDGQGFNKKFIEENQKNIKIAKKYITSIANEFDFVNILLNDIGEDKKFVKSSEIYQSDSNFKDKVLARFGGWHSLFSLLDEELKLNKLTNQSEIMINLKKSFNYFIQRFEDEDVRFIYYNLANNMAQTDISTYGEDYSKLPKGMIKRYLDISEEFKKEYPELSKEIHEIFSMFIKELINLLFSSDDTVSFKSNELKEIIHIGDVFVDNEMNLFQKIGLKIKSTLFKNK